MRIKITALGRVTIVYVCVLVCTHITFRSRTSSVSKMDDSELIGPQFESYNGHLRKICLCCWTSHFTQGCPVSLYTKLRNLSTLIFTATEKDIYIE